MSRHNWQRPDTSSNKRSYDGHRTFYNDRNGQGNQWLPPPPPPPPIFNNQYNQYDVSQRGNQYESNRRSYDGNNSWRSNNQNRNRDRRDGPRNGGDYQRNNGDFNRPYDSRPRDDNRRSYDGNNGNRSFNSDRSGPRYPLESPQDRNSDLNQSYESRDENRRNNDGSSSYRSDRSGQRYQREPKQLEKPPEFDKPFKSQDECTDDELRYYLNITNDEVPIYVMRMRKFGASGYPPALIDEVARVSSTLPFLGDHKKIFTKRIVKAEDLKPFRGFTHIDGETVSEEFVNYVQKVADIDYEKSHENALKKARRSGLVMETIEAEEETVKVPMEAIVHPHPEYEVSFDEGYAFGDSTKAMKHTLDGFKDGIQPFVSSEPNAPSFFMEKLKSIMKKNDSKQEETDEKQNEQSDE